MSTKRVVEEYVLRIGDAKSEEEIDKIMYEAFYQKGNENFTWEEYLRLEKMVKQMKYGFDISYIHKD